MATRVALTLHQNNAETIDFTIDRVVAADDLTDIEEVVAVFKDDPCDADTATTTLTLSSTDPAEIILDTQTATQITGRIFIPAAALTSAHERWWRVDAVGPGPTPRTAIYGPVTVIDL